MEEGQYRRFSSKGHVGFVSITSDTSGTNRFERVDFFWKVNLHDLSCGVLGDLTRGAGGGVVAEWSSRESKTSFGNLSVEHDLLEECVDHGE